MIQSQEEDIFGAFLSDHPCVREKFVGTGESWLFRVRGEDSVGVFKWSGENSFFMKGDLTSLVIGAGRTSLIVGDIHQNVLQMKMVLGCG